MCVVILSGTVGTKYFDSNHMEKVEAVGTVVVVGGITLATMFEICLFVGTVALAAYGIHEGYENREEIARFGKEFIDSCGETAEGWVMQFVDASGQDYVFGSEALELVRGTEWSVIQGGLPPEGDPNNKDDKDKDKFHIPGDPMTHVAQFTALGATWFTTNAQNIYQDWCDILDGWTGKDTPIPQNNVLANNFPQSFTGFSQNEDGTYNIIGSGFYIDPSRNQQANYSFSTTSELKIAAVVTDGPVYTIFDSNGNTFSLKHVFRRYSNSDGVIENGIKSRYLFSFDPITTGISIGALNLNIPYFSSLADMNAAFISNDYSNALNYGKDYRIADWLQQDWAGELIDPLVHIGLSLTQLIDLMKALGLKTLQGLSAAELLDLLKNALPKLNPELNPGAVPAPAVDPVLDPIYYPDPDAHPDKPPRPVIDPDPTSGPTPGQTPGTDPDPGTGVTPLPDMEASDYKVDLKSIFPFCIPFDFVALLKVLDASPRAPCFTIPVVIPALNYREDVKLDMSIFDDVAKVIRLCEKVSFILFLMFVTSKVIRW